MSDEPKIPPFGLLDEEGKIIRDVRECAVTGQPIVPGDVTQKVAGTLAFYRVSSQAYALMTDEEREEIAAAIREALEPPAQPVKSSRRRDEPAGDVGASAE